MVMLLQAGASSATCLTLRTYVVSAPRCSARLSTAQWTQQKLPQRPFHKSANRFTKPKNSLAAFSQPFTKQTVVTIRPVSSIAHHRHFSTSRTWLAEPSTATAQAKDDAAAKAGPSEKLEGRPFHPEEADGVNVLINQVPPVWLLRKDPRHQGESLAGYIFSIGRAYLKFYMGGRRNIGVCKRKAAYIREQTGFDARQAIDAQLREGNAFPLPENVSRSDFQLLLRSRNDRIRQPLFVALVLICGETLPIILYLLRRHIVPYMPFTCRTESQEIQLQHQREIPGYEAYKKQTENSSNDTDLSSTKKARQEAIARGLSLALIPTFLQPTSYLVSKLERYRAYEALDDRLLARDGGPDALSRYEMMLALTDRAYDYASKGLKLGSHDRKVKFLTEHIEDSLKAK